MDIKNYIWITGKIIPRLWGTEYRYTVARPNGGYINDIVILPDGVKTAEDVIAALITEKLKQIDVKPEIIVDPVETKVAEIKALLVAKELLVVGQDIQTIKSKSEILAKIEILKEVI